MKLRTMKSRLWASGVAGWLFMMATFGTVQLLTGGGWWGYLVWTGLFAWLVILAYVIPKWDRWIKRGETDGS